MHKIIEFNLLQKEMLGVLKKKTIDKLIDMLELESSDYVRTVVIVTKIDSGTRHINILFFVFKRS